MAWRGREVRALDCPTSLMERVKQQGLLREVLPHYLGRVYSSSNIVSKWLSNGREEGRLDREKQERY